MKDFEVSLPTPCAERWDAMAPRGCNRHCACCDTVIHDLSQMSLGEAEALLTGGAKVCVRARVAADGTVALRRNERGQTRVMKAAIGGALALAVAACQTTGVTPLYELRGKVGGGGTVRIVSDNGTTKEKRADRWGNFRFANLRAGTYTVSTWSSCDEWVETKVEGIELVGEDVDIGEVQGLQGGCIIVGVMTPSTPRNFRG